MTVEELYQWAKENNVEKCEVEIQYRDGGGIYYGTDELIEEDIEIKIVGNKGVVVL